MHIQLDVAGGVYGRRQPARLVHLHVPLRTSQSCPRVVEVVAVQQLVDCFQWSTCGTAEVVKGHEVDGLRRYLT